MAEQAQNGNKPVTRHDCGIIHESADRHIGEVARDSRKQIANLRMFILGVNATVVLVMGVGAWLGGIAYAQARTNEVNIAANAATRIAKDDAQEKSIEVVLRQLELVNEKLDKLNRVSKTP